MAREHKVDGLWWQAVITASVNGALGLISADALHIDIIEASNVSFYVYSSIQKYGWLQMMIWLRLQT